MGGFRGGAEGAAPPLFFVYFQNVFETLTLLYFASRIRSQCCMLHVLKSEVFIRGWGIRPPLSEFSGSAPGNCQQQLALVTSSLSPLDVPVRELRKRERKFRVNKCKTKRFQNSFITRNAMNCY